MSCSNDSCVIGGDVSRTSGTSPPMVIEETSGPSRACSEGVADESLQRLWSVLSRMEKNHEVQFDNLTNIVQQLGDEIRVLQKCTTSDSDRQTNHEVRDVQCPIAKFATNPEVRDVQFPTTRDATADEDGSVMRSMTEEASTRADERSTDRALHAAKMDRVSVLRSLSRGTSNGFQNDVMGLCAIARARHLASQLVGWRYFDTMMGFVVFLNCVIVGLRIDARVKGRGSFILQMLEEGTVFVYIGELLLRVFAGGFKIFKDEFVVFDAVIVAGGIISLIESHAGAFDEGSGFGALTVIKTARLLRLIRSMRMLWTFEVLGKLVNGMFHSLNGMISVLVLIVLFLYIFACVGIEIIREDPLFSDDVVVEEHFAGLPVTMLSLFAFVTLDSISEIYFPLIRKRPVLVFYFVSLILVMSMALVNLITAYILDASIQRSKSDNEMELKSIRRQIKKLKPAIREAFGSLDLNADGQISKAEVIALTNNLPRVLTENMKADSMLELFEMIDDDDSGSISHREFEEAIIENACGEHSLQDIHILKLLRIQKRRLTEITEFMKDLSEGISRRVVEDSASI
eukprot:TRINITY_DN24890_c0_g2_i1.p1 TRINITY_DN24890_c0_g2~~TRINITY_DN24890_c0_g2_i1.p1  ORF type:complete len:585 (+),score=92.58 TRINITY_DN24890_c0_g2_i1:40-1755(+)